MAAAPKYAKYQPAGFTNRLSKVAIIGAGGTIGRHFATHLLATGKHTVTALTRAGSTTPLPTGVVRVEIDYASADAMAAALRGQDVLIITLSVRTTEAVHTQLVRAAAAAGVPYVVPNVYCPDPVSPVLLADVPVWPSYKRRIDEVREHGMQSLVLSCGFWYEFSLGGGVMNYGVDFDKREVTWVDGGSNKWSTSTFPQCGRAMAALLSLPVLPEDEAYKSPTLAQFANGVCYTSSFVVSQKDIFESIKRVTGTSEADWTFKHESSADRIAAGAKMLQEGKHLGHVVIMYARVLSSDAPADAEDKEINKLLGLPKEDIDEATKEAIEISKNGGSY